MVKEAILPTDQDDFLQWCKKTCDKQTAVNTLMDLSEVGQFFTAKMADGDMPVANLSVTGFDLLQSYFVSANEALDNIKREKSAGVADSTKMQSYNPVAGTYSYSFAKKVEAEPELNIQVMIDPLKLAHLDIVWKMALECQQENVIPKAKDFLIRVFSCLSEEQQANRMQYIDSLIERCMELAASPNSAPATIVRALQLVKQMIYQSEKCGTGDNVPHNGLLKGELIKKLVVKDKDLHRDVVMTVHSNTTVWEFKKRVGEQMRMIPKYLKLQKGTGSNAVQITAVDNGKTL